MTRRFSISKRALRGATLSNSQQGPNDGTPLVDVVWPHACVFAVGAATSNQVSSQAIFRVRVGRGGVFSEELVPLSIGTNEYCGESVTVDVFGLGPGERASAIVSPLSWPASWDVRTCDCEGGCDCGR